MKSVCIISVYILSLMVFGCARNNKNSVAIYPVIGKALDDSVFPDSYKQGWLDSLRYPKYFFNEDYVRKKFRVKYSFDELKEYIIPDAERFDLLYYMYGHQDSIVLILFDKYKNNSTGFYHDLKLDDVFKMIERRRSSLEETRGFLMEFMNSDEKRIKNILLKYNLNIENYKFFNPNKLLVFLPIRSK